MTPGPLARSAPARPGDAPATAHALASADIIVVLVAHRQFRHLRPDHLLRLMVVDAVGLLNPRT